ncbi:hypothetical protein MLD38_013773 [Melastoma candidum]|uniref:Uncharacterized protein n=1 Tax=Melastoma candidum TaxID=119954 RepID=A0ACB9RDT0_9MYRT|nr:hypothetical protein MLD38_013773 [Melastoma candidum]
MGTLETERTTVGWAARDPSGVLSPYTYNVRNTGAEDVYIKVLCCGLCHPDIHQAKNDLGMSRYPILPILHTVMPRLLAFYGCENWSSCRGGIRGNEVQVRGETWGRDCRGCCGGCTQSDLEQYCSKKIWNYNDVYTDGKPKQGGFAGEIVVHQKCVVKIPEGLESEQVAPLLCAGITVYSPLRHFALTASSLRGGILGLGGVGHMGVKIAQAMGHHVTVISSSAKKKDEALEHLGVEAYLVSSYEMKSAIDSLDYIIDAVPVVHPLEPYISLLKLDGKLIITGVINAPLQFMRRKSITGTFTGSTKETEEMLEFCKEKGLTSQIEVVK